MDTFSTAKFKEKQDTDFSFLKGKEIIEIGILNLAGVTVDEGGLAIDYVDVDNISKRVVLGFNELGMWKTWQGCIGKENDEDILKRKIRLAWDKMCEDKIHIVSKPFIRSYEFVNSINEVVLSLTIQELKLMGREVCDYFSKPFGLDTDCENLISKIGFWVL